MDAAAQQRAGETQAQVARPANSSQQQETSHPHPSSDTALNVGSGGEAYSFRALDDVLVGGEEGAPKYVGDSEERGPKSLRAHERSAFSPPLRSSEEFRRAKRRCGFHATRRTVAIFMCCFYTVGASVCLMLSFKFSLVDAAAVNGSAPGSSRPAGSEKDARGLASPFYHWAFTAWGVGVALGLLQGFTIFRWVSKAETRRIIALREPRAHDFFTWWRLCVLATMIMTLVILEKVCLGKIFVAMITLSGVVTMVSTALTCNLLCVVIPFAHHNAEIRQDTNVALLAPKV
jgi:hypothetical protein